MRKGKINEINRILVVDDTKTDRDLFKYLIVRSGFDVEVATDGLEALELLNKKNFDLVLCDYLMPNLDGYEFLQKVREEKEFSHVIVIIITSDESDETWTKLRKGGANDVVHKGDSHEEIMARIRVHLDVQAAHAHCKVLEMACTLAEDISQPVSVLVSKLDELEEKIQIHLPEDQRGDFQGLINTLNKETDAMVAIVGDLKESIRSKGV